MEERHVHEELLNIINNAPLWAGHTILHATADECGRRGWAKRDADARWVPTIDGILAAMRVGHFDVFIQDGGLRLRKPRQQTLVEAISRLRGALDPYRAWWQDDEAVNDAWMALDMALESRPPTLEDVDPQDRR